MTPPLTPRPASSPESRPSRPPPRVPFTHGLCGRTSRSDHGGGRAPGAPPASIGFPSPHAQPFVPAPRAGRSPSRDRRTVSPAVPHISPPPLRSPPLPHPRPKTDAAAGIRRRRVGAAAPHAPPRSTAPGERRSCSGPARHGGDPRPSGPSRHVRAAPDPPPPRPPVLRPFRRSAAHRRRSAPAALRRTRPARPAQGRPAAPHRPRGPQCRGRPLPQGPGAARRDKGRRGAARPGSVRFGSARSPSMEMTCSRIWLCSARSSTRSMRS